MIDGGAVEPKLPKRWRRKARGGSPEGWINKTTPDELRKVGHAPTRAGAWNSSRRRRWCVDDRFPAGFPPTCRSTSCASKSEVSGRRRAGRKKSSVAVEVS